MTFTCSPLLMPVDTQAISTSQLPCTVSLSLSLSNRHTHTNWQISIDRHNRNHKTASPPPDMCWRLLKWERERGRIRDGLQGKRRRGRHSDSMKLCAIRLSVWLSVSTMNRFRCSESPPVHKLRPRQEGARRVSSSDNILWNIDTGSAQCTVSHLDWDVHFIL